MCVCCTTNNSHANMRTQELPRPKQSTSDKVGSSESFTLSTHNHFLIAMLNKSPAVWYRLHNFAHRTRRRPLRTSPEDNNIHMIVAALFAGIFFAAVTLSQCVEAAKSQLGVLDFHRRPYKFAVSPRHLANESAAQSLQTRLLELRALLALEIAQQQTFGAQSKAIGSPCTKTSDCDKSVANSHCRVDTFACACLPNHIEYNSTTCLPRKY